MGTMNELDRRVTEAVAHFWKTRTAQARKQEKSGKSDQGARAAVTGGAQMDGFIGLVTNLIVDAGMPKAAIFYNQHLELPGFFRPTKEWDLLVVREGQLVVALEVKSQVGPSFGNNFNNRTEEAMGTALDLWTAYEEGAFNKSIRPWLGYLFLLEDCKASRTSVKVSEPHFKVFPEFKTASYATRYEFFCRKLMRKRHYDGTAFLMADSATGIKGKYSEPAEDLTFQSFARSLTGHISTYSGKRGAT